MTHRIRRRRGGHLIEFALVFPVFFLLLAGVIDWGWMFYHRAMLDRAAIDGCRAGSLVNPGAYENEMSAVKQAAKDAMRSSLTDSGIACDSTSTTCDIQVGSFGLPPGRSLECVVNYEFRPLLGVAIDTSWMDAGMVTRMEWQVW